VVGTGEFLTPRRSLSAKISAVMDSGEEQFELTLKLLKDAAERLRQRAATAGQTTEQFVSQLLNSFAQPPASIESLSGPIYQRFLESGMIDDELSEELEQAKQQMRAERRARHAS
jgi:hypothetical protein